MSLHSEYKFLIEQAVKNNDHAKAQELREWAFLHYDLPLLEHAIPADSVN